MLLMLTNHIIIHNNIIFKLKVGIYSINLSKI